MFPLFQRRDRHSLSVLYRTMDAIFSNSVKSQILAHNPLFFYSPGSLLEFRSMVLIFTKSQSEWETCICLQYFEWSFSYNPIAILLLFCFERQKCYSSQKHIFVERKTWLCFSFPKNVILRLKKTFNIYVFLYWDGFMNWCFWNAHINDFHTFFMILDISFQ